MYCGHNRLAIAARLKHMLKTVDTGSLALCEERKLVCPHNNTRQCQLVCAHEHCNSSAKSYSPVEKELSPVRVPGGTNDTNCNARRHKAYADTMLGSMLLHNHPTWTHDKQQCDTLYTQRVIMCVTHTIQPKQQA